jgi:hypothetical protein
MLTIRSAPSAPIKLLFLAMLWLHRELRWMNWRLKPLKVGPFLQLSHNFGVFLHLLDFTGALWEISALLRNLSMTWWRRVFYSDLVLHKAKLFTPSSTSWLMHHSSNIQTSVRLLSSNAMQMEMILEAYYFKKINPWLTLVKNWAELLWIIRLMIRNCMLWYAFWRPGNIIFGLKNLLYILIMNHWNILEAKKNWINDMLSRYNS